MAISQLIRNALKGAHVCVCVCAFQSVPRYDEYRSSVTVSDLRLRDILSGLDTRQFTVPDGADFHLFKVNIYMYLNRSFNTAAYVGY